MKLVRDSLIVIVSILFVFIVIETNLSDYIAPILIGLILFSAIYILIRYKTRKGDIFTGSYLEFIAVTDSILLAIFLTGGVNSTFFFLTYFLLFGMSFIFEPLTIFIFLIGLIGLFLSQAVVGDIFTNAIRLGSLALLSPIAYFFGRELSRREKERVEENHKERKNKLK